MIKKRVLFVCIHNSARSQMAEAFLNALAGDRFIAESAGLEPGTLNPRVVQSMADIGIDISGKSADSVFDFFRQGRRYYAVIAVCDPEAAERCPIFPGTTKRMHWPFADPSNLIGTDEERLKAVADIRDAIRRRVEEFIAEHDESPY